MIIWITMLVLGLVIGFAGAGGSGFVLALLVTFFHVPVHTALGTSMAAMVLTVASGSVSHFREGNMVLRTGLFVGICGAAGSYAGTFAAALMPPHLLVWASAALLFLSSFLVWLKTRLPQAVLAEDRGKTGFFWGKAAAIGLFTGFLSGTFGIGSTPLIQLGLLVLLGFSLRQAAATSMLIILPISFFGGIGYLQAGYVDFNLLLLVVAGMMTGSYIGAKFTARAPMAVLRSLIIGLPILGGLILLY